MSKKGKEHALVPRVRFPEFRDGDAWQSLQLTELYRFKRTNTLSRDKLNYEGGTVKNIHYGDIHTKFQTRFRVGGEYVPYVDPDVPVDSFNDNAFCEEGDIVLADASEDLNDVGKAIEIVSLDGQQVVAGTHTILATRHGAEPVVGFGGYLFQSAVVRAGIQKQAQGAKVYGVSANRISTIPVPLPPTPAEQRKIADCLGSLDDLIAAEGRKLAALRNHKKGLMQQLFPREGENRPRLRFPEFRDAGEWDRFLLARLEDERRLELGRGKVISHDDMRANPGPHPVYSSSVIDSGLMGTYGDYLFDEELISWSVDGGGHFFYRPKHKFSITNVSGFMRVLSDDIVCQFLAYQLQRLHASETFNYVQKAHPSVIRTLYAVGLPNPSEQHRIAECLSTLDAMIAGQVEKLDALRTHKRGLMQQLFPSPEEAEA
ncbi:restriction endonuclease subunit S [Thioalkalivibrio sp. ALE16]|uniref:restriction endonuclease subunit S n=1 Tax=Thioalkalivibrio sp. ALE16 TaxID=1158172 RepID=UPI00037F12A2|nr:restriction endonuclease subunit S [Thioalkalivibrio sp. ALE16]